MGKYDKVLRAYQFFRDQYNAGSSFSITELMAVAGWSKDTVRTYISKQYRDFLSLQANGQYVVRAEIQRLSEEDFLRLTTQNREIFAKYQRVKYHAIVTYEFLLPLTREDQLRKALDALFYKDTIRQRLLEIRLEVVEQWIERDEGSTDEDYIDKVCSLVSDKFGGYSISHVSGRYRAAAIASRADAAQMLTADERYIVDETTASVRFILPVRVTRVEEEDFDEINLDENEVDQAIVEEISLIHSLFFNLFVEAVVRTVQGEDEIWLVEETTRTRSLYTWQKT